MATIEKNRLYNPLEWSKRFKPEELDEHFKKFCIEVTDKVRKTIKSEHNIPYGITEHTKYDIYGIDLPKDAPILIFIPGGYWQEYHKDTSGIMVPLLVKNKIKVVIIEYDICPDVKISDIVIEVKSCITQILKYAADSGCKSVSISGHSAGAHLAASLLHDKKWIKDIKQLGYFTLLKGIVLISGVYDLRPLRDVSHAVALHLTEEEAEALSWAIFDIPEDRLFRNLKVVVICGDSDSPQIIKEARQYVQKVIDIADNVQYIVLPEIDHYNIIEHLVDPNYILIKLLLDCFQSDVNTK